MCPWAPAAFLILRQRPHPYAACHFARRVTTYAIRHGKEAEQRRAFRFADRGELQHQYTVFIYIAHLARIGTIASEQLKATRL